MTRSHPYQTHFETCPGGEVTHLEEYPSHSVPYHIITEHRIYSLDYATLSAETAFEQQETRTDSQTEARIVALSYLPTDIYGVYTTSTQTEYGSTNINQIANTNTSVLVDAFRSIFEGVMDNSDSTWHKPINLVQAGQVIDDTQWKQRVPNVAGDLLSGLILAHTLPNTNHRSSLAFTALYLSQFDEGFDLEHTLSKHPRVTDWIDSFISESKRVLTTRRNIGAFHWLHAHDIKRVVRKNNVTITLDDYNFSNNDLHGQLTQQHAELCTDFISDILILDEDTTILVNTTDPGKSVFADRVDAINSDVPYTLGETVARFQD